MTAMNSFVEKDKISKLSIPRIRRQRSEMFH